MKPSGARSISSFPKIFGSVTGPDIGASCRPERGHYGHGDLLSVPALTKSGQRISVEFTIAMLKDAQGRPTGTVAILRDVTRRFEEARALKRQLAEAVRGK
jgi:hypothetical protein